MDRARTANSEIWTEGDVLMVRVTGEVPVEEIERISKMGKDIAGKTRINYSIIDITNVKDAPFGMRKADPSVFDGPAKKTAFVCQNAASRIVGSFFLKRYEIPVPVRMFSDAECAKKWFSEK